MCWGFFYLRGLGGLWDWVADPRDVAALLAPSAFTAGNFFLGKSCTKPLAPTYGPYAALRGPLATAACGPARPTTCYASLHLAPSATPKGATHLALQPPPLGLLRSRVDQDQKQDQEQDQKPEQRQANRCALAFPSTFVLCCGGSRDLSFEDNASSAATHNGSAHDLDAKPSQAKPSSPTIHEEPKERGKPTMRIGFPHHHSISVQCSATALRLGASLFCSPGSSIGTSLPSASNSLPSLK